MKRRAKLIAPTLRVLPARLMAAARRGHEALGAMRQSDRLALTAAVLALVIGLDLLVVMPLRDKRVAIEAAQRSSAIDQEAARSSREAELDALNAGLQLRQAQVAKALAGFGAAGKRNESLRFLLSQTLQGMPVTVLSLRALGVDEVEVAPADANAAAPTPAAPPASAADASGAPAAPTQTVLYRHRYELKMGGGLPALFTALEALERNTRPLRIERVRLQANASGEIKASVVLMTLGSEATWLSL